MNELSPQTVCKSNWMAFSPSTDEATARAAFRSRYGCDPEVVGLSLNNVLAGPVPHEVRR